MPVVQYRVSEYRARRQKEAANALGISQTKLFNQQQDEWFSRRAGDQPKLAFCDALIDEFGAEATLTATLRGPQAVDLTIGGEPKILSTRRAPSADLPGLAVVVFVGNHDESIMVAIGAVIDRAGAQVSIQLDELRAAIAAGADARRGGDPDEGELPTDPDQEALPPELMAHDGTVVVTPEGPATFHADPIAFANAKRAAEAARDADNA